MKVYEACCFNEPQGGLDGLVGEGGETEAERKHKDKRGEARVCGLVRAGCKALQKRGSEQAGVPERFKEHCARLELKPNLVAFKGHRYLALYRNSGELLRLQGAILDFLDGREDRGKSVWELIHGGPLNKLLLAVRDGFRYPLMLAGLKTLGLLEKQAAGRIMMAFKRSGHILDANTRYLEMRKKFTRWSKDATAFLEGELLFPDLGEREEDEVLDALKRYVEQDTVVKEMLELNFCVWLVVLERMAKDQLPEGKFDGVNEGKRADLASVKKENDVSERDFATLDRVMREKPNFLTIALEGVLLFKNNGSAGWLGAMGSERRAALVHAAMKLKPELDALHRQRQATNREQAETKLREAREREAVKRRKEAEVKAELVVKVTALGGLWKSEEEVESGLEHVELPAGELGGSSDRIAKRLEAARLEAVKDQLRFRKHVLSETYTGEDINFTAAGKELGLEIMKGKLVALLAALDKAAGKSTVPNRPELRPAAERGVNLKAEKEKLAPEMVPEVDRERERNEAKERAARKKLMLKLFQEAAVEIRRRERKKVEVTRKRCNTAVLNCLPRAQV
ncbi:hypothetical protein KFL_003940140 [Klebsormidium nitens]|uniref:Uncharacterized protein n=1 Tax=Klebsormidium nitens TaxID=105231 RepID=A0A1Y1IBS4_KLENI|nr:hypothetical protein KFL_003940140 [Klebsormidium nitens]|eukprot:GAQ88023.1 hypothetical protein KFL_003940140 [Klebsormidium nitens]